MRFGLCLLLVSACGGSPQSHGDAAGSNAGDASIDAPIDAASGVTPLIARSGSRLKLAWYQTADGVRVPTSNSDFYDSLRAEQCTLWYFTDGHRYCAPLPTINPTLYYADAACTTPVFKGPIAIQYAYEISATGTGCPSQTTIAHLYKAGAMITPPATLWTKSGATCGNPMGPGAGAHIYSADEVLTTDLAEVTTTHVGTGPLQQTQWQSADGLLWPLARGYDVSLATECAYQDDTSTSAHCTPAQLVATDFADATCSVGKAEVRSNSCATPTTVAVVSNCGAFDPNVYALGSAVASTPLYDGFCNTTSPTPGATYYAIGPVVGASTILTRSSTPIAGQRLAPIFVTTTDVAFWDYVLYDPVIGAECGFTRDPSNNPVCAPRQVFTPLTLLYADNGCTVPVDVVEVQPTGCGGFRPIPTYAWKRLSGNNTEIHKVTTLHAATLYAGAPNACEAFNPTSGPQYPEYFDLDPTPVPWSSLETANIVVDP